MLTAFCLQVENGSVMGPLHDVGLYAVQLIKKMQNEKIRSWVPRQEITNSFNEHVQEWIKHTVWKDDCRSWYKVSSPIPSHRKTRLTASQNNETGRVNAVWPGSSMHYQQVIQTPRYEDFDITYFNKNPWGHLGMGWTVENRKGAQAADCSPYLNLNNIDPKWYEAIGGDVDELTKQVNEYNMRK